MDTADFSSLEEQGDILVDNSASFVKILANQVDGMRAVYEEANALKEQQRVILDKRHVQVLAEIAQLEEVVAAETQRFSDAIAALDTSASAEIARVHSELLETIRLRFEEASIRMQAIEEHQVRMDAALEQEILERQQQTEALVGKLRDQLVFLNEAITIETEIRKNDLVKLRKTLDDKVIVINRDLDEERLQREISLKKVNEQLQQDLDRTDRRQLRTQKYAEELVDGLAHAVRTEAKTRGATQTSIVQCVTVFVEKFKNNLDAEVNLNKN